MLFGDTDRERRPGGRTLRTPASGRGDFACGRGGSAPAGAEETPSGGPLFCVNRNSDKGGSLCLTLPRPLDSRLRI